MTPYSKEFLVNLYKTMVRIRTCEESLVDPILKGEVKCPCHLYSGQEAIATGVCAALEPEDYLFGNHRSHGHYLAKGGNLAEMIAEIYGKSTGCSRGRGGSMHLIAPERGMLGSAPIVSGTISLATGAALSSKIRGEKRVTVSFFGDGAVGEGVLYEAFNFAALQKLPILFVCENNYYSTHMSIRECRPQHPIVKIGEAFGIESFRIDGNDVLKVYETAKRAIDRCRIGVGPTFLECSTYRFRGHVGPDDNVQGTHTDIRSKSEIEKWMRKDPIKRFERRLFKEEILTKDDVITIHGEAEAEVGDAFDFARQSPYPEESELTDYVFKS